MRWMRWIYLGVIIPLAAATIIFALRNFAIVTMSAFGFDARVPLAVLVAIAYVLGAATGGRLFALLRGSYEGSRRGWWARTKLCCQAVATVSL